MCLSASASVCAFSAQRSARVPLAYVSPVNAHQICLFRSTVSTPFFPCPASSSLFRPFHDRSMDRVIERTVTMIQLFPRWPGSIQRPSTRFVGITKYTYRVVRLSSRKKFLELFFSLFQASGLSELVFHIGCFRSVCAMLRESWKFQYFVQFLIDNF